MFQASICRKKVNFKKPRGNNTVYTQNNTRLEENIASLFDTQFSLRQF